MGMNTKELGDRQNDLFAELSALPFERLFEEKKRLWKELGYAKDTPGDAPVVIFEKLMRYLMTSRLVYQDMYSNSRDRVELQANLQLVSYYRDLTQPKSGYLIRRHCLEVARDRADLGDVQGATRWEQIANLVMELLIEGLQKGKTS